jgi:hypothetical protein
MMRTIVVVGTLLLGAGAVMAQQEIAVQAGQPDESASEEPVQRDVENGEGRNSLRSGGGRYRHQGARRERAQDRHVFATNPKEDVVNATYGSSQKIWQNKADFDSKIPRSPRRSRTSRARSRMSARSHTIDQARCNDCHEIYRLKLKCNPVFVPALRLEAAARSSYSGLCAFVCCPSVLYWASRNTVSNGKRAQWAARLSHP